MVKCKNFSIIRDSGKKYIFILKNCKTSRKSKGQNLIEIMQKLILIEMKKWDKGFHKKESIF